MPLSVVDLYKNVLPQTNCRDCGFPTCIAFATMVVAEKLPLRKCPHVDPEVAAQCQKELDAQHAEGTWTKRDLAQDALVWARERVASMKIEDLPERIGGEVRQENGTATFHLPYFTGTVLLDENGFRKAGGEELSRWEQVFLYNHIAQGGRVMPTGNWKDFQEFPNTLSKVRTMRSHVETPLAERFGGHPDQLKTAAEKLGGTDVGDEFSTADAAIRFQPLPRVPVLLLFWDRDPEDDMEARVKLLFDETATEHLDIESILFLSEHITGCLTGDSESDRR